MSRALGRARRGIAIDVDEAAALLSARGEQLTELMHVARDRRQRILASRGRGATVTYSPKVFIPLTHLCRDRCHYCTFAVTPAALRREGKGPFLEPEEVLAVARDGAEAGCLEALFTLGDRPEDRWPVARAWLDERGYDSTLAYVRAMAIMVLEQTGLLPHLNPGVMTWSELGRLRPVAPSMGLMLETSSDRLFRTPGMAHYGSPDKDPAVRLRTIEDAGRQSIPFTSGLLLGIGETAHEAAHSVLALRSLAVEFGHLQEIIVQNFRAKPRTAMANVPDLDLAGYLAAIATTRLLMPDRVSVQAPPNLTDRTELTALLDAGLDDWGGISPVTPDHVNPERPWPEIDVLAQVCAQRGFELRPRLTVYPQYVGDARWLDPRIRPHVVALSDSDGYAIPGVVPVGQQWQENESYRDFANSQSGGRTDLASTIDLTGRRQDRRADFDVVYGDWDTVARQAGHHAAPSLLTSTFRRALDVAVSDPAAMALVEYEDLAVTLMAADGPELRELCRYADALRREVVGEEVSYVVNRNLNFTNVCYTGCRFCAFAQRKTDADAFTLSVDEIQQRVREAWLSGATEICMQGGIHPDLPGSAYFDLARAVKQACPQIHLHAFSPMEIMNGVTRTGLPLEDWLAAAREAGVDSIPGTAAEILDDEIRWILTKGKLPAAQWIDVVKAAHRVGLRSSSTMMYGHVDQPVHWVRHLRLLREIQLHTQGFTEFVGLPFVHHNAPLYLAGVARAGSTRRDDLAVTAMSRIMLFGAIDNIQVSWVKLGKSGCAQLLCAGANDLGGTLMEETISRMAGSEHGSSLTVAELVSIADHVGRPTRERTTLYGSAPKRLPVLGAQTS